MRNQVQVSNNKGWVTPPLQAGRGGVAELCSANAPCGASWLTQP